MRDGLVFIAATLLVVTAIAHSGLGERRLIRPLLQRNDGVLGSPLARFLIRFAWHMTSLTWIVLAATLVALIVVPDRAMLVALMATGAAFTAAGVFDGVSTRGRHIGWPLLTGIGLAALAAAAMGG